MLQKASFCYSSISEPQHMDRDVPHHKKLALVKGQELWKASECPKWHSACADRIAEASVQFSSVAQSCPTLCDPMNRSTPGLPIHHQLPEFTETHVHRVSDAIQPYHPLSSPSPPAPNPSQNQSFPMSQLLTWGGQSIGVSASASVPPINTQDWSPLGWTGWISLQSKGLFLHHKFLLLRNIHLSF